MFMIQSPFTIKHVFSSLLYSMIAVFLVSCASQKLTFTNPLLDSGADPWSIYKDGFYYYTQTSGNNIVLRKTKNIAHLKKARKKTIFEPPPGTSYSKQLWAPEIHFIQNSWYVYFAADDGKNENHRLYVLENTSGNPMNNKWTLKGKLADSSDKWAIDGSVFEHNNIMYLVWSGWEGDKNGRQDLYIAKMQNPWTLESNRVRISSPTLAWERFGNLPATEDPAYVAVNEGPQILKKGDSLFLIYSASGCWTDHYALGMLAAASNSNLLDSVSWRKRTEPVFTASFENGIYAPGHNSFFTSPDGTEDWILYHANSAPGQGCGRHRSPRAQKFRWNSNGTPDFGVPVKTGEKMAIPADGRWEKEDVRRQTGDGRRET
jgi:GH43 family beta-xylosidase